MVACVSCLQQWQRFLVPQQGHGGGDRRQGEGDREEGRPLFTLITKAFPIPRSRPTDGGNSAPEGNMRHAEREEEKEEDGTRNQLVTLSGCLIVEFLLQWESVRRQKKENTGFITSRNTVKRLLRLCCIRPPRPVGRIAKEQGLALWLGGTMSLRYVSTAHHHNNGLLGCGC